MWEHHFRLCAVLLFLIIPIAIADFTLLKANGGGWISLDFTGILTGAFVIVVVLHIAISTFALKFLSSQSLWVVHSLSGGLSFVLFCAGTYAYFARQDNRDRDQYEATRAARAKLFDVLSLDGWTYLPTQENATEIVVTVTSRESGRFSCNANGIGEGEYGEMYFHADQVNQRQVEKGEHFTHSIPLKWVRPGVPALVEVTLYLFADSTGSAGRDVIKIFTSQPATDDDGHSFYGVLPPSGPLKGESNISN